MNYRHSPSILTALALAGCSLTPAASDSFTVASDPSGAEVFVLGAPVGTTPVDVSVAQVFPATYPAEKETLYGRVVVRKEGCEEKVVAVSTRAVARGLTVRLDCAPPAASAMSTPTPAADDVAARLQRLETLRRDGTITEPEYEAHRRRILESL